MKIVYDTLKKEFEPFSIRIETEDEAKIITELLAATTAEFISSVTGKLWVECNELENKIYNLYEELRQKGFSSAKEYTINCE